MNTSDLHQATGQLIPQQPREPRVTRVAKRRAVSRSVHRAALWVTLAIGGGMLVYNAFSVMSGEGGLAGVSEPFQQGRLISSVGRFGG